MVPGGGRRRVGRETRCRQGTLGARFREGPVVIQVDSDEEMLDHDFGTAKGGIPGADRASETAEEREES